jgi:two-component system, cell cycle response regulator DivK
MMKRTVLVVEDEPDHREILSALLRHGGYAVETAADGEAGVEAALRLRPAVVLMDVSLPRLDGWVATERIKAAARDQCVVILTAHALAEHREMAERVGCDYYLTKPIPPKQVLELVRRFAGEPEPDASAA